MFPHAHAQPGQPGGHNSSPNVFSCSPNLRYAFKNHIIIGLGQDNAGFALALHVLQDGSELAFTLHHSF